MQNLTNNNNLRDVIPPMECIPCPDCGDRVTMSPHPNSHCIAGMDDCLYHGQCRNTACSVCSKKNVFLVCIACLANNSNTSINGSTTGVTKSMKTATKHAKSKQHINSMKFWKKQLLMQEQQILYPTDASFDNEVMNEPLSFEPSENNNIPKTFLPGHTLKSLNELKNHGFDPESNAPEFMYNTNCVLPLSSYVATYYSTYFHW